MNRINNCKILGIDVSASQEEIKKAYKKLVLKYHPDKCNDADSNEKFVNIQKAYEELTNNDNDNIVHDAFEHFNFHNQFQPNNSPNKLKNSFYECKITLKDIFLENTKKFNIKKSNICKDCHIICNHCKGNGCIKEHLKFGPFVQILQQNCNKCFTNGVILNLNKDCNKCDKGNVIEEQLITIKIDYKTHSGKQLIINNWGEQPTRKNDLPGDLIITLFILDDPIFKRHNDDLVYNCKLTLKESIIGKQIIIPHYISPIILNTIGFGIINYKKQYTISNKGFGENGNLVLIFDIIYPEKTLLENEIDIIQKAFENIGL